MGGLVDWRELVGEIDDCMNLAPLFFDLDHTLWDFESNSRKALRLGYDALKLKDVGVNDVDAWIAAYEKANDWCWEAYRQGKMDKETLRGERFRLGMKALGLACPPALAEGLGAHYIETSPYQTALMPGTHELLQTLKQRGHRMWILTNGFEEVQHIKMSNCGLDAYFEDVYTSDALGVKKPHGDAFRLSCAKAGLRMDEGVIMVGDSWESDVQGAQDVGWRAIHFNPSGEPIQEAWRTAASLLDILDMPLQA